MLTALFDFDSDRTMIGPGDFAMDEGAFETRPQCGRNEEIINSPADVPRARSAERRPPCIMAAALLEFAESVNETGFHKRGKPGAFLYGETVVAHVGLGIGEVNLRVRHVQVAAENDWLLFF